MHRSCSPLVTGIRWTAACISSVTGTTIRSSASTGTEADSGFCTSTLRRTLQMEKVSGGRAYRISEKQLSWLLDGWKWTRKQVLKIPTGLEYFAFSTYSQAKASLLPWLPSQERKTDTEFSTCFSGTLRGLHRMPFYKKIKAWQRKRNSLKNPTFHWSPFPEWVAPPHWNILGTTYLAFTYLRIQSVL